MTTQYLGNAWLGYKTNQTMTKIQSHAQILTTEIAKTLQQFREVFGEVKQFLYKGLNVIDLVGDIMMALMQVSFAKPGCKIASLSVELFRLLSKHNITTTLVDALRTYIQPYFNDRKDVSFQVETEELDNVVLESLNPTHIVMFC